MSKRSFFTLLTIALIGSYGFANDWAKRIERINTYTKGYDPYVRIFSYNPSTNTLTWVTRDGDITCSAVLTDIDVVAEPGNSSSYVTFNCKNKNSKCIYCNYDGPKVSTTSISVNSAEYARKIADEINGLSLPEAPASVSQLSANESTKPQSRSTETTSWMRIINEVNELTKSYDPYTRNFTYEPTTKKLTWITGDKDITCSAYLDQISITATTGSVSFQCNTDAKCIYCNYTGDVNITSITINKEEIAKIIAEKLQSLNGISSSGTANNFDSDLSTVNNLCVKYDPYIRNFTFNPLNKTLKWVNKAGDITCEAVITDVTVTVVENTKDFSVMFTCINADSKCISCTYGGNTQRSSITVNDKSAAYTIAGILSGLKRKL